MTNPLIIYIEFAVALSLLNTIILMRVQPKSVNSFYPSTFYAIMITNFGFLFQALSTNLHEALLANKIVFVGGAYLPIFLFMALVNLCHLKISNALRMLLFSISGIIYLLAITSGYSNIFYSNAELVTVNGISKIQAEFGPGYILFCLQLIGYGATYLCIILFSLFHKKNVSFHSLCSLAVIGAITLASFAISKKMGVENIVMPGVFLVDEYILLILVHRMGKYDIETTILNSLVQTNTSAYVTFTKSKRYIGCNDIALNYFPQMKDFQVDLPLDNKSETEKTFSKLIDQFHPSDMSKITYFQLGNNHYKCLIKHLFHGNSDCGYMMRIEDDTKMQRYIKFLDKYNSELVNDVQDKDSHIHAMQEQMIVGMANMVENRDSNTGGHIKRTSQVIRILISEMRKDKSLGLSNKFCRAVVKAAPMHDLGKIAVDDMILRKPGKFTSEEYSIMKTHAEKGAAIVENLLQGIEDPELVTIAKNIANYHHELWNGDGYPKHLKGTEIPLEARIMAIADVYDALVSQRCYKEKISCEDAYEIIINSMGTHFDPGLKPYFISCREELEAYYSTALAS
ncbi:HD domain-containing phosphohydrolase [uncultured Fibrobacter sp.]|uniref:HD domain-containing phosphohydrolase n=1 Tax=uncultured Fibrobacter sp. TaxID=261512 RepID=UPI0025F9BC0B|nr:HD domain-containing phosphohydrolase [uncultured Fibrobacter sp.]